MPGSISDDGASFTVQSTDGTAIMVWVRGAGPPIVLVHGSLRNHTIFDPLVAHLQVHLTTYAIDRRGFGASGDAPDYAIQREFEDVAAVVDAVASRAGRRVILWGHSYGAGCAMGASTLTDNVDCLVLYEPGLGIAYPPGWLDINERALAAGDAGAVIHAVLVDVLEMNADDVLARKSTPLWAEYEAAAPTVLREARTESDWEYQPGAFDGIRVPTLIFIGTETAPALMRSTLRAAAAIPEARIGVLAGHGHLAYLTDPGLVSSRIVKFAVAEASTTS
jgi:pimeloyl-ACP methyl ester carboxylesterase